MTATTAGTEDRETVTATTAVIEDRVTATAATADRATARAAAAEIGKKAVDDETSNLVQSIDYTWGQL